MNCNKTAILSLAAMLASSAIFAEEATSLGDAITSGKAGVSVRARYEHVDQDNISDKADALTARLRLNYKTGQWKNVSLFGEFDYVFHLLRDFNSGAGTSPDKGNFPVVADPKGADLNQLYFDYAASDNTTIRGGRQRILLDNQRFVGGVGWRQNEQTYDAFTVKSDAWPKTKLQYSYIGNVRRIFGEGVSAGTNNVDTHLLNAKVGISDDWSLTPYYYRIDNDDVAAFSTQTFGVRLGGSFTSGDNTFGVVAELATQSDIANNPVGYDAEYAHLSGTWIGTNGLTLGIAWESLGGDPTQQGAMFRTPLATLHAFQGWADRFLSTPSQGIDDLYFTAKYKVGDWNLTGIYHDFSAEAGSGDFGTELDLSAGTKIAGKYGLLFKGAFFSSDSTSYPDTNKFWIMFTASY